MIAIITIQTYNNDSGKVKLKYSLFDNYVYRNIDLVTIINKQFKFTDDMDLKLNYVSKNAINDV
ncbi:hypothetical protein B6C99_05810 [Gilliamella sp. N-G2]|nr:hypothetical protein B6C99_05810 [Gilliamella sp. N-G2]OTQ78060.1 hypothetical protein B6D23_09950 [Gilliamella sp. N-W3]